MRLLLTLACLTLATLTGIPTRTYAQFTPPPTYTEEYITASANSYYSGLNLESSSREEFVTSLHILIVNHTIWNYELVWDAFRVLGETEYDSCDSGLISDIYSTGCFNETQWCRAFYKGTCYQRELLWVKSWFGGSAAMAGPESDLHHVFPAESAGKTRRGVNPFAMVSATATTVKNGTDGSRLGPSITPGLVRTAFEPRDNLKGDIARAYFYMMTAYADLWSCCEGTATATVATGSRLNPWVLAQYKQWHVEDPPSALERERNQRIYELYQQNRNPYIDHPEWVDMYIDTLATMPKIDNTGVFTGRLGPAPGNATQAPTAAPIVLPTIPPPRYRNLTPPAYTGTYYDNISTTASDSELLTQLHYLLANHTGIDIDDVWVAFESTEESSYAERDCPTGSYADIMTAKCVNAATRCNPIAGINSDELGNCWIRGAIWPKGWYNGIENGYGVDADLFNLYPADGYMYSRRANFPLAAVTTQTASTISTDATKLGKSSTEGFSGGQAWEPRDHLKGDFARAMFYISTAYADFFPYSSKTNLDAVNGSQIKPWAYKILKQWHQQDPVSMAEVDRNNAIYMFQGNRNPFIDHPEWIDRISEFAIRPTLTNQTIFPIVPYHNYTKDDNDQGLPVVNPPTWLINNSIPFDRYNGTYYESITNETLSNPRELLLALHILIQNHTIYSYKDVWTAMLTYDQDEYDGCMGNTIHDPYSYNCWNVSQQCGSYTGQAQCYNREHSWPKSWFGGFGVRSWGADTDFHHLYPTDGYVNGHRGNWPFAEVKATFITANGGKLGTSITPGYTGTAFEPINAYKGDFARTYFYMTTMYADMWVCCDRDAVNGSHIKPWQLSMLKRWHQQDPVSASEMERNNDIFAWQKNRNPFVDHPEWVDLMDDFIANPPIDNSVIYHGTRVTNYTDPTDFDDDDDEPTTPPTTPTPTTEAPTTLPPTTEAPTTEAPTTLPPTTEAPTTEAPTTEAPTTPAPTTAANTTVAPTTLPPTTLAPSTGIVITFTLTFRLPFGLFSGHDLILDLHRFLGIPIKVIIVVSVTATAKTPRSIHHHIHTLAAATTANTDTQVVLAFQSADDESDSTSNTRAVQRYADEFRRQYEMSNTNTGGPTTFAAETESTILAAMVTSTPLQINTGSETYATQTCADGTTILAGETCPAAAAVAPVSTSSTLSTGALVGIIVGGAAALVGAVLIVILLVRRRSSNKTMQQRRASIQAEMQTTSVAVSPAAFA